MTEIEIEIDGRKLMVKPTETVIEAADKAGIYIPRFCYHKHLSVAANCRMCLVEVDKSPKALPACATPVAAGMKVLTKSAKTIEAQRAVMEFLLINHPLDCPICDQGGECELQDLSMGYGSSVSHYDEGKRALPDEDIGPLIATDMTRCIYCTRCVRFGTEVAGMREMGGTFRGEHTEIGTYIKHAMQSEVSGNIIDLCPVGALTSKPYRFTARAWELTQAKAVSPHDCTGSNLNVHTRYGKVMRVVSRENAAINETWLSDRDRFSYTALQHEDRLGEPQVKIDGQWKVVSWQKALEMTAAGLQEMISTYGADQLGALASPNATLEEFYLLQKLMRGLGSHHIDHRLRETDARDQLALPAFPALAISLAALEQSDVILLLGSNLQKEQPIAALRVRKAALRGATVLAINPVDYPFNFKLTANKVVAPQQMVRVLTELASLLEKRAAESDDIAHALLVGKQVHIVLGALALHHPLAATIRYLAQKIAAKTGATLSFLTSGANGAGGWLAGAIPHRQAACEAVQQPGLTAHAMLAASLKSYVLLNVEPERDCANAAQAVSAMKQAAFVVALSTYRNPVLEAHANVILPVSAFTETSGTYINAAGEWQSFTGVASAYEASRPAWKVLRVLGNFLHLNTFTEESSEEVRDTVKAQVAHKTFIPHETWVPESTAAPETAEGLWRVGEIPLYATDALVRRALPLQAAQTAVEGEVNALRLHPDTAKRLNVQADQQVTVRQQDAAAWLTVSLDERMAREAVWVAGGLAETATLGDLFGPIEIG